MTGRVLTLLGSLLLAGFLGALLIRQAPGYGVDERELDPRLRRESVESIRKSAASHQDIFHFYAQYLTHLAHGDLGVSRSLGQPVRDLLRDRLPVTSRSLAAGLSEAWLAGFLFVLPPFLFRLPGYDWAVASFAGIFLCVPSTVVALAFLYLDWGTAPVIAAAVFPRVFRFVRNLLLDASTRPHILAARARGLGRWRIFLWHIIVPTTPPLIAVLGVSVTIGLTASIPAEALCDSPGIGQLAWTAALGRDLPLLVTLTLLVATVTLLTNLLSEALLSGGAPGRS